MLPKLAFIEKLPDSPVETVKVKVIVYSLFCKEGGVNAVKDL